VPSKTCALECYVECSTALCLVLLRAPRHVEGRQAVTQAIRKFASGTLLNQCRLLKTKKHTIGLSFLQVIN
jgi:hypothetical protein